MLCYDLFFEGLPKTGPPRPRLKLLLGVEEGQFTRGAEVGSLIVVVPVCPRKGGFRSLLSQYLKLLRREGFAPLRPRLNYFSYLCFRLRGVCGGRRGGGAAVGEPPARAARAARGTAG